MRNRNYVNVLKPSVGYLQRQANLLLDTGQTAEFLGVRRAVVDKLIGNDRIPCP
jgi:hypothetical protein